MIFFSIFYVFWIVSMAPYIGFAKNIAQICRGVAKIFFSVQDVQGGSKGRDTQNVQGGYNPTFLTLRGETIFQAKRGDQSRTMMAKGGGHPPLSPPFGHVCASLESILPEIIFFQRSQQSTLPIFPPIFLNLMCLYLNYEFSCVISKGKTYF